MMDGLIQPHNLDAEQSVLGAILLDNEAFHSVAGLLRATHFYKPSHARVYECMTALIARGQPVDSVTLVNDLTARGLLDEVGGVVYLVGLSDVTPTSVYAAFYAGIVVEKSRLRDAIAAAHRVLVAVHEGGTSADVCLSASKAFADIASNGSARSEHRLGDVLSAVLEDLATPGTNAVTTGFMDLDARWGGGLRGGELVCVAARPSMGKSSFAMGMALNMARKTGRTALMFSLEMPAKEIAMRFLSEESKVHLGKLREKNLTDGYWSKLTDASASLADVPLVIDDGSGVTIAEITSRATRLHRAAPLSCVVLDYVQLMCTKVENRVNEIGAITAALKRLARDLDIPVIMLSQLSRDVEKRADKRPIMADLRDSGSLEQDSDIIAFIYRDDYYDPNSTKINIAEIITSKQRNGSRGTTELQFQPESAAFRNLAKQ